MRAAESEGQATLEVEDDGAGMTEAVRLRCPAPFFTTRRVTHTGLGLNRVYHAALRHGGTLRVDSTPGHGTRVTLVLPLRRPE